MFWKDLIGLNGAELRPSVMDLKIFWHCENWAEIGKNRNQIKRLGQLYCTLIQNLNFQKDVSFDTN